MGNLDFSANADQLKELAAYMASQINVPTIGIGGGYAPIGSINFFDATVAPQDWLACDGSVYNIADYPQLADWYEAQHGSKNFYGGDGTTTFAVPNLQGEFLRGTGTNSHTNQGSGANVGVHQDGTIHDYVVADEYGNLYHPKISTVSDSSRNLDTKIGSNNLNYTNNSGTSSSTTFEQQYTSRPTNTSFLICVKAVVAGDVYSTEERVVGTWIDGKSIYQKTFTNLSAAIQKNTWTNDICTIPYGDKLINYKAYNVESVGIVDVSSALDIVAIYTPTGAVNALSFDGGQNRQINIFTAQYTKTTD